VLSSIQRIGPDLPETIITLDASTGRVEAGPKRHEADQAGIEEAIVVALKDVTGALTEAELEPAVEGRTTLKRDALRALVVNGRVTREGKGAKGNPFRYRLAEPPPVGGDAGDVDSCSLVPGHDQEQENTNPLFAETPCKYVPDSRSQDLTVGEHESEPREQPKARVKVRL